MIIVRNDFTNPYFNLALEEYAVKHLNPAEDYVILWQNEPSVIIGRNQNTFEEINARYMKDHNIPVIRRLSGGGAVYHDLGNINYSIIVNSDKAVAGNYQKFTKPILQALDQLGVMAELSGKSNLFIQGKKFSGNSQFYYGGRLLHHGTLLFDAELSAVSESLQVRADQINSKGVKSIRSSVTNIKPHLATNLTVNEFKELLLDYIILENGGIGKEYILSQKDLTRIRELMTERYSTWEWNYGASPEARIVKSRCLAGRTLNFNMKINQGLIEDLRISGDIDRKNEFSDIEKLLIGKQFREGSLRETLNILALKNFTDITTEEFIDSMLY